MHRSNAITAFLLLVVLMALWGASAQVARAHGEEAGLPSSGGDAAQGDQGDAGMFVTELFDRQMKAVRALMDKDQYGGAINRLNAMAGHPRTYNRYERALLQQTLGYALASAGDYDKSAGAFQKALSFKALPKEATLSVMQNLGQLYIAVEQYEKGIAVLETWMARVPAADIQPRLRVLLGNAYMHQEDYAKAASQLERAIGAAKDPEKAWFQLLATADTRRGRDADAARVLQQAIAVYPKERAFWQQLAAAYRRLREDSKAAATLALACGNGLCRDEDKLYLARLYLYLGLPVKAARVLRAAVKDGSLESRTDAWLLLADSWWRAREPAKAASAYREAAVRDTKTGKANFRLGQIYVQQEKWQAAVAALGEALKRGHLANPGRARLLLGISRFYLGDLDDAARWLEAAAHDAAARDAARRWLRQVRAASSKRH